MAYLYYNCNGHCRKIISLKPILFFGILINYFQFLKIKFKFKKEDQKYFNNNKWMCYTQLDSVKRSL